MMGIAQVMDGINQRLPGLPQGLDEFVKAGHVLGVEAKLDVEDIELTAVLPNP